MPVKIMVADDATFVRDMIKRTLRTMVQGVELLEAPDGARARVIIKQKQPDLILSDWEMPELSGEELLQWLREESPTPKTPFIMITSRGDREHVMAAVQAGVNDYISKPFTPEELIRKVAKQLKKLNISLKPGSDPDKKVQQDSLSLLTSGATKPKAKPAVVNPFASPQAASAEPKAKPAAKKAKGGNFEGRAVLRLAGKAPLECAVREASLQALGVFLIRPDQIPCVFDQAVVDLADKNEQLIATINAYIHSVQAVEPNAASRGIKVVVRFVDNDPAKMEALSLHL
ncbi:response regulator [Marinagarivorans algicola]|uniref:response regulator n=1 Tax=Marinagarivorans algicola TaxID=1513270 RepID=UPI0006B956CB|nr:response regulator [Marinagarivorans algicola]